MKINWKKFHSIRSWRESHFRQQAKKTKLFRRLDGSAILLIFGMVGMVAFFCIGLSHILQRVGVFDDPILQPVEDERKVNNFWNKRRKNPIFDGVYHHHDGKIYLSSQNGEVHHYDPRTKLWGGEKTFSEDGPITPEFTQLRSGSGATKNAISFGHVEPDIIWALNDDGGLARRVAGVWEVVVGDRHSFLDENSSTITSAAVSTGSSDTQWIMLGSAESGVGIYDASTHSWREQLRERIAEELSFHKSVSFVAWFDDKFWVVVEDERGKDEIFTVSIDDDGSDSDELEVAPYPVRSGLRIKDFEVDQAASCIWLLAEKQGGDASDCTYLAKITGSDEHPRVVLDEGDVFPDFSTADVRFMQQVGDTLAIAGKKGVFTYDLQRHSWERVSSEETFLFVRSTDGQGFYFAYGPPSNAGIGKFSFTQGRVRKTNLREPIKTIFLGPDGQCMAMTDNAGLSNDLYLVEESLGTFQAKQVFEGTFTEFDPEEFTAAVTLDDNGKMLFFGPEGILKHDVKRRTFENIPKELAIPEIVFSDELFALRSGDRVFFYKDTFGGAEVQLMQIDDLNKGNFVAYPTEPESLEFAKYLTAKAWDTRGSSIRTTDRNVYILPPSSTTDGRIVGQDTNFDLSDFRDVALLGDSLWFTDGDQLHEYKMSARSWQPAKNPKPYEDIKSLVSFRGALVGETSEGQLANVLTGGLFLSGKDFRYDVNSLPNGRKFLGDGDLRDVFPDGNTLYLAGEGRIWSYNLRARSRDRTWDFLPASDIEIVGVDGAGNPIFWSPTAGKAYRGNAPMPPFSHSVLNLSMDPTWIWTVREDEEDDKYLQANSLQTNQPRVFFKHPKPVGVADGATRILDARLAGGQVVCVATDEGLALYYPKVRSWVGVDNAYDFMQRPERIFQLAPNLLALQKNRKSGPGVEVELISLSLSGLNLDAISPIELNEIGFEKATSSSILTTAYDEPNGRMAYLTKAGKVVEFNVRNATETVLLDGQGNRERGPDPDEIWRVYDQQGNNGHYLFATQDAIWRYDVNSRLWNEFDLDFPGLSGPAVTNVNVEFQAGEPIVGVTAEKEGKKYFYYGYPQDGEVGLAPIFSSRANDFSETAGNLLDVQSDRYDRGDPVWRFVLRDKIKSYDPRGRLWSDQDLDLGEKFDRVSYKKMHPNNSDIVVIECSKGNDKTWFIHEANDADGTIHPSSSELSTFKLNPNDRASAPLIDEEAYIWRLDKDYQVIRMSYVEGVPYAVKVKQWWPKPFYLDQAPIKGAYEWRVASRPWDDLLIFESATGLRILRPSKGNEIDPKSDAKGFSGVEEIRIRQKGRQLWVKNPDGYLVLERGGEEDVSSHLHSGIKKVIFDVNDDVWGLRGKDWLLYDPDPINSKFVDPRNQVISSTRVSVFARDGVPITGVDDKGFLYYQKREDSKLTKYAVPLPNVISPDKIHNVVHDNDKGDNWWVLTEDALYHLLMVNLEVPLLDPSQLLEPDWVGDAPPDQMVPVKALPILAIQKKIPLNGADFDRVKDAVAVQDDLAEGITFYLLENGVHNSISWNRKKGYLKEAGKRRHGVAPALIPNKWPAKKKWVKRLKNNRDAYDPVFDIEIGPTNEISFVRPSGPLFANANTKVVEAKRFDEEYLKSATPLSSPVLDAGWLAWDRVKKEFKVKTVMNGRPVMQGKSPTQLISQGKLFFEEIESLITFRPNLHWAANSFGVIQYPNERLQLDNPGIAVTFAAIKSPITGAHGRFVSGGTEYRFGQGAAPFKPLSPIYLNNQRAVALREKHPRGVSGSLLDTNGNTHRLFHDDGGFIFDANRRALAYSGQQLLIQTDAGIHPLDSFNAFDPGPKDAAMKGGAGVLVGEANRAFLKVGQNQWQQWNGAGWNAHLSDPAHNRSCFDDQTWKWSMVNNALKIDLKGGLAYNFNYLVGGEIGFTSDQLNDATAHNGFLYLATDAFFEAGVTVPQLENLNGLRSPPVANLKSLRNLRSQNGDRLIKKSTRRSYEEWSVPGKQFTPLQGNPYTDVLLAEYKNLRFRKMDQEVVKEIKLADPQGTTNWVKFEFSPKGRFAFDEINSITTYKDKIFLATDTGVQVYDQFPLDLNGPATHLMSVSSSGGPAPSTWVGQPIAKNLRGSLVAKFANSWVKTTNGQQWTVVSTPPKERVRVISSMMIWSQSQAIDKLRGVYRKDPKTTFFTDPAYNVDFKDDHLLHDRISDFIDFEGDSFTVWATPGAGGRMVTWHEGDTRGGIEPNRVKNFHFKNLDPDPLLRIEKTFKTFKGTVIEKGVYLKVDETYQRFHNEQFNAVNDLDAIQLLENRRGFLPVLSHDRFRLELDMENGGRPKPFEYRMSHEDVWQPVDWSSVRNTNSTTIDRWDNCFFTNDSLWVASKAGLVEYKLKPWRDEPDGLRFDYHLDPLIIPHDSQGSKVTDFKEGTGGNVFIRFDRRSDRVYQVDLQAGKDTNVFTSQATDVFSEEQFVKTSCWEWNLKNRVGNSRYGDVEGVLKTDEPIRLEIDGGRFRMDKIHSLAVSPFEKNQLEVATDDGWFRFRDEKFHLKDMLRPDDVELDVSEVRHLGVIKRKEMNGGKRLLVEDVEGKMKSIPEEGELDDETELREFQGSDGFWNYQSVGGPGDFQSIEIWTNKALGTPRRLFKNGRFGDDFVLGLPAMAVDEAGGISYHLPTKAGVFQLNSELGRLDLAAIEDDEQPSAITMTPKDSSSPHDVHLTYVTGANLRFYKGSHQSLSNLDLFPKPDFAQAIEEGPYELTTVRRKTADGIRWSYFDKNEATLASAYIEVSSVSEYKERKSDWRGLEAKIYYECRGDHVIFWTQSAADDEKITEWTGDVPRKLGKLTKVIEYTSVDQGLIQADVAKYFMIGEGGMYEIDVERLIAELTPPG